MARRDLGMANGDSGQGMHVIIAWAIIGLPLAWGVQQTVVKALALFR